jgi:hypothetical protein
MTGRAVLFQSIVIEKEFLHESSKSEFSHSLDPNRTSLRRGTTLRGDFLSTKCAAIEGQSLSYVTRGRSLRSGRLCNDTLQPRDVFQEAPTGQDEEVIAELRVLKVDFK